MCNMNLYSEKMCLICCRQISPLNKGTPFFSSGLVGFLSWIQPCMCECTWLRTSINKQVTSADLTVDIGDWRKSLTTLGFIDLRRPRVSRRSTSLLLYVQTILDSIEIRLRQPRVALTDNWVLHKSKSVIFFGMYDNQV